MENYNVRTLPFGKVFRVANFSVIKVNRTLSRKDTASLRKESGLPDDFKKRIERVGLPVIKVSAISGVWAIEFAAPSQMFRFLDATDIENPDYQNSLHNLFTSWFVDTSLMGDTEYIAAKGKLIQEFADRQKPNDDEKADEAALAEVKTMEEAKAGMADAVEKLKEE